MKSKYVLLASALLISVATFAQKDQIKAAEKALKAGNAQEAITILQGAESASATAPDTEKAQFCFVKGNAFLALANKNEDTDKNLSAAAKAYQDLLAIEKASGKAKYSAQASTSITDIKYKFITGAIDITKNMENVELECLTSTKKILDDYKLTLNAKSPKEIDQLLDKKRADIVDCEKLVRGKYVLSASKLYDAYLLDKKDTINLYYAASTYVNAKEYDKAYNAYDELKKLNYSGKGVNYFAVNKVNGEEQLFTTARERDQMVKLGTHEKPRTEEIPSKRGEIYKNMALILVQNGKVAEAKKAVAEARATNPDDKSLILTEANLYLDTKDYDTYKKLITEVLAQSPNDADLVFNLGVISYNAKNLVDAETYYKRAIEIKPDYVNAFLNLAILKLDADKKLFEEIQKLGNSEKDNKRYEVLKKQREVVFTSALPYLEKASELDGTNEEVKSTLLSVYRALEMTEKAKALKAKMKK
jgi:tetratricopeptide (TPR) repeat protein